MKNLLLLDLDGTIRVPKDPDREFISNPYDQVIIPEAAAAIAYCKKLDWEIVGITNQAGVASGHKTIDSCIEEQKYTLKLCPELTSIFFCPDFEGYYCHQIDRSSCSWTKRQDSYPSFRKPKAGMLDLAIATFTQFAPDNQIIMVGDRDEDSQAANAANVKFFWAEGWRKFFEKLF